jgi:hypothetical protein
LSGHPNTYILSEGCMVKIAAMMGDPRYNQQRSYTVRGIIFSNGLYDMSTQIVGMLNQISSLSIFPGDLMSRLYDEYAISAKMLKHNPEESYHKWSMLGTFMQDLSGQKNFLEDIGDTSNEDSLLNVQGYLWQDEVIQALHLRQFTRWERFPTAANLKIALKSLINSSSDEFTQFLESEPKNISILFAVGAFSGQYSVDGFQQWLGSLPWKGKKIPYINRTFFEGFHSMTFLKEFENKRITYAIFADEGTVLGRYSLNLYLKAMKEYIINKTICGLAEDDSQLEKLFHNCSSKGVYNSSLGSCVCNNNDEESTYYYGADCSIKALKLPMNEEQKITIGPHESIYYMVPLRNGKIKIEINGLTNNESLQTVFSLDTKNLPLAYIQNDALYTTSTIMIGDEFVTRATNTSYAIMVIGNMLADNVWIHVTLEATLIVDMASLVIKLVLVAGLCITAIIILFIVLWRRCRPKQEPSIMIA